MKLGLMVNEVSELGTAHTSLELACRLLDRDHHLFIFDVASLGFDEDHGFTARALELRMPLDAERLIAACHVERSECHPLRDLDVVLVRTSPGRDPRTQLHQTAMGVLAMLEDAGTVVLSSPSGLLKAATKAYLGHLPQTTRPAMSMAAGPGPLKAFLAERAQGVLKPVSGTRGSGVFLVDQRAGADPNLSALADTVCRDQYALAQEYQPEAPHGDVRVLVLQGGVLRVGSSAACVRRRPGAGEFRSNVHCGGRAHPGDLTPAIERAVAAVGPQLVKDGIFLAGLDFVGSRLVEVNVFGPGGVGDAGRFHGCDFYTPIVEAIEARGRDGTSG